MKNIAILGSTGSIGISSLDLIDQNPDKFKIVALSAGNNIAELAKQIKTYQPQLASCQTETGLKKLKELCPNSSTELMFGEEGACAVASISEANYVISAIVGAAGLAPTVSAIKAGKTIALANKESLVVAGAFITQLLKKHPESSIIPVDSEHSAIFQCLDHKKTLQSDVAFDHSSIQRMILTASGGPFFLQKDKDLETVSLQEALKHPNWSMGSKITIDSATLMNKGLEAIEAHWLFQIPVEKIDIVVHPQSIVHSMVEYTDGSIIAQLSKPDMKGPIAYALGYPERIAKATPFLDFAQTSSLEFHPPNHERFPAIRLCLASLKQGADCPAVLNGSNEVAVAAFLQEKIKFTQIVQINQDVLSCYNAAKPVSLQDFIAADQWGRQQAQMCLNKL